MDIHAMRAGLLKVTFIMVLVTSWVSASFLFATRPEAHEGRDTLSRLVRLPASLPKDVFRNQAKVFEPIRMEILQVPCWNQADKQTEQVEARWVRLTGRDCAESKAGVITVRNLSNGYVATVFSAPSNQLTTDFILLESGDNQIQFRFEHAAGVAVENQFTLNRKGL